MGVAHPHAKGDCAASATYFQKLAVQTALARLKSHEKLMSLSSALEKLRKDRLYRGAGPTELIKASARLKYDEAESMRTQECIPFGMWHSAAAGTCLAA